MAIISFIKFSFKLFLIENTISPKDRESKEANYERFKGKLVIDMREKMAHNSRSSATCMHLFKRVTLRKRFYFFFLIATGTNHLFTFAA